MMFTCGIRGAVKQRPIITIIMPSPLIGMGITRWCCLTSVCLSRTSDLSPEQRGLGRLKWHRGSPRHTWLGHHFQGQKVKGQSHQAALLTAALTRQAAATVSIGTYWAWEPTATLCRRGRLGGARRFGPTEGGEGRGHIVAAIRLQLVMPPPLCIIVRCQMLLSDVCLSVAYIGRNSRTERPKKTKIGTETAHVTRDSDTTFKVKRSMVNLLLVS